MPSSRAKLLQLSLIQYSVDTRTSPTLAFCLDLGVDHMTTCMGAGEIDVILTDIFNSILHRMFYKPTRIFLLDHCASKGCVDIFGPEDARTYRVTSPCGSIAVRNFVAQ